MRTPVATSGVSQWREFAGKQTARCVCGKGFGQVAPGVTVKVRARPEQRAQGSRHLTHRCRDCKTELDLLVLPN